MNEIDIANTIRDQLGAETLAMLGAKDLISTGIGDDHSGGLRFKIGRNPKGVTHIRIRLNHNDFYDVDFIKQHRAPSFRVEFLEKLVDIFVGDLHDIIERETGLRTSLGLNTPAGPRRAS